MSDFLLDRFKPTHVARNFECITPEALEEAGLGDVNVLISDSDGTTTDYHAEFVEPSIYNTFAKLTDAGLWLVIESNAYDDRIPILRNMYESSRLGMKVVTPVDVADGANSKRFRKPKVNMTKHILDLAAVRLQAPVNAVMVGDQMMKDVWSANRAGIPSILVPPRGDGDDKNVRRYQRPLERMARERLGLPIEDEDYPDTLKTV